MSGHTWGNHVLQLVLKVGLVNMGVDRYVLDKFKVDKWKPNKHNMLIYFENCKQD